MFNENYVAQVVLLNQSKYFLYMHLIPPNLPNCLCHRTAGTLKSRRRKLEKNPWAQRFLTMSKTTRSTTKPPTPEHMNLRPHFHPNHDTNFIYHVISLYYFMFKISWSVVVCCCRFGHDFFRQYLRCGGSTVTTHGHRTISSNLCTTRSIVQVFTTHLITRKCAYLL
jgi:hypothetical protein